MIVGIDINQKIEYSSKSDTTEPKTVFVFQPLSGIQMIDLANKGVEDILDKAIVEIRNFSSDKSKTEMIKSLPINVITELMQEITKINNITEADKKN